MNKKSILHIFLLFSFGIFYSQSFAMEKLNKSRKIHVISQHTNGQLVEIDIDDVIPGHDGSYLHLAAAQGDKSTLIKYIALGANINNRDSMGNTPLIVSTVFKHSECIRVLLERGADASLFNDEGIRAFEFAEKKGVPEIVELFKEYNADKFSKLGWTEDGNAQQIFVDPEKFNKLSRENQINFAKLTQAMLENPENAAFRRELRKAAISYGFIDNTQQDKELQRSGLYKSCQWQRFWIPFDQITFNNLCRQNRKDYIKLVIAYIKDDQNLGNYRKLLAKASALRFAKAEGLSVAFDKCMKDFVK